MVYNLYSVCDVKTSFAAPYVDVSDESAARGFHYAFANNPGIMSFSPADFRLYRVGKFDSRTGSLSPEPSPVFVCDAVYRNDSSEVSCNET